MKRLIPLLVIMFVLVVSSCADSKNFVIEGETVHVEPYGWFDTSEKDERVVYKINTGNIVWSVLLSGTIVVPLVLTGDQLYEPVKVKPKYLSPSGNNKISNNR